MSLMQLRWLQMSQNDFDVKEIEKMTLDLIQEQTLRFSRGVSR